MTLDTLSPDSKVLRIPPGDESVKADSPCFVAKRDDWILDFPTLQDLPRCATVNIEFHNISYSVKKDNGKGKKMILNSITGQFRSGELTAIMGPSGAGKSSLMNILAGLRKSNVEGDLRVNGKERNARSFRKMSCYIMQRDELIPHLSLLEAVMFAANIKLGNHLSPKKKDALVNDILTTMSLKAAENTRTSNLSGGERRRLSIALELVNNPPVMFFDEPTSGLDSSSCIQCIALLKRLAQSGRTIVCIIHQPSSMLFETFDRLYLLAEGQCVYRGLPGRLVDFLSSLGMNCPTYYNPADYVIDIATGKYGYVIDKMAQHIQNGRSVEWEQEKHFSCFEIGSKPDSSPESNCSIGAPLATCETLLLESDEIALPKAAISTWKQFYLLFQRSFVCSVRDLTLTRLRLAVHLVVGVLVGLLYYRVGNEATAATNNMGFIFFNQLFLMFTALMATVLTYPMEMPVLKREHLNNWYSLKCYHLAKTAADLPFQIVYPTVYLAIVYFMTNQPAEFLRFVMFLSMGIMTSLVAQSIGVAIGAATDLQTAVFVGPVSTAPIFLFSGFFITFSTIPVYLRWLCYVVYVRYGFEGTLLSIYGFEREPLHCSQPYCLFKLPAKFLSTFDMNDSIFWVDLVVLVVYYLAIRVLAYFILKWKIRKSG